jgi:hypothetical protein
MIAVCLGLTLLYFALLSMFGHHVMIQALLYAAFPIAYTMAARRTSPKPYSHVFRYVGVVAWYAFFLAVTSLSALV